MRKSRKGILSIFLAIIMIVSTIMAQNNLILAAEKPILYAVADKDEVQRGETVKVRVYLEGTIEAASGQMTLNYDQSLLELVEVVKGDILSSSDIMMQDINQNVSGKVSVAFMCQIEKAVGAGTLITAEFKVKDAASGNINFTLTNTEFNEIDFDTVDVKIENENISVSVPVQNISLNKKLLVLNKGAQERLLVTYSPEDATNGASVQWSSSNNAVATVTNDGTITAIGKGNAVITAKIGEVTAECQVQVNNPLTGISIKETLNLKKGQSEQLDISYQPEDADITTEISWSSDNEAVATVSKEGRVTAQKDGTARITVRIGDLSATCVVTVQEIKLDAISLSKEEIVIEKSSSEKLEVFYEPEETTDDKSVTWSVSDSNIISVDGSGIVTGKAVGKAIVTARVGQCEAQCVVVVNAPLKEISFVKESLELIKGQTSGELMTSLSFTPADTTDSKDVIWTSSNPDIAEIDEKGNILAKKAGSTTITADGANGTKATCVVVVKEIPIEGVVLDVTSAIVEGGETVQLSATVYPENTTDNKLLRWESKDDSIATVDENGLVTAHKGGKTVVVVMTENGKTAECEITVPIHMTGIEIVEPETTEILKGNTISLKAKALPENTTDDFEFAWSSSNSEIATVDKDGMVVALKEGEVAITVTSGKFTDSITINVKEIALEGIKLSYNEDNLVDGKLLKGQTLKVIVTYVPENTTDSKTVTWSSSNEEVAYVDPNGIIVGVKAGTVTITAQVGGIQESLELEVIEIPLKSIAFDKVITNMVEGGKDTLHIIYDPHNTTDLRDVSWSSSDESIIFVENGNLIARKTGTAVIIAEVGDQSVSCEITVLAKDGDTDNEGTSSNVPTGDATGMRMFVVAGVSLLAVLFVLTYKKVRR